MSGHSSQQQTQQSVSQPWQPAIPFLQSQLGQIGNQPLTPSAGQQTAAGNLVSAAGNIPNFGPAVGNTVNSYLDPNFTNPYSNPAFSGAMQELLRQAQVGIGSEFAGAGRDPAGNAQGPEAIARGFAQGAAPALANEYNSLLGFQQNAPNIAGMVPGLNLAGPTAQLGAATTQAQLPLSNVLAAEQATIPIAGLGGSSFGSGTANTSTFNPLGIASLFGTGGISPVQGMVGAGQGILSGLGNIFGPSMSWGR